MTMRVAFVALLAVVLTACGWRVDPVTTCTDQAADYGPSFSVAGAFAASAGRIRQLYPAAGEQVPETAGTVILCYLDGPLSKGPPPENGGAIPPSFDRAVVAVINDAGVPLVLGYQADIPVADPTE
jgi:hypothetical protein